MKNRCEEATVVTYMAEDQNIQAINVAFIIIASLAFCANSLVCVLFAKNRVLLKKSYNVFLLILAITDLLTAIVLLATSSFILQGLIPRQVSHLQSEIFCRLIWSNWIAFTLSSASVYICLVLTYKRWCAVVKPLTYRANFNKRHLLARSVAIWLIALLSSSPRLFAISFDDSTSDNVNFCGFRKTIPTTNRIFMALIQLILNIVIPSGVMTGIYLQMLFKTRIRKNHVLPSDRALRSRQGRTRMVKIALLSLMSCWMPYQVLYLLSMFGITEMTFPSYHWTTTLVFVASCINPFIYGVTNHTYRRGYFEIALGCCPVKVHGFLSRHLSLAQTHHAAILVQSIHGRIRPVSAPHTIRQSIILELTDP